MMAQAFAKRFEQDMATMINGEGISGPLKAILLGMVNKTNPADDDAIDFDGEADMLKAAISEDSSEDQLTAVVECLCIKTVAQIAALKGVYETKHGVPLVEDMDSLDADNEVLNEMDLKMTL